MRIDSRPAPPRSVPFVLFGAGGVGSALLEAIVDARDLHRARYGIEFSALAVCDSSAAISNGMGTGLSDDALRSLITHKAAGLPLTEATFGSIVPRGGQGTADFLTGVATRCAEGAPGCIIVDCSATDGTVPALLLAAEGPPDARVVSANKKPFADASMDVFRKLVLSPRGPQRVRFESTVGAGLPVIAALQRVIGAADTVSLVSGAFSGTLGFVMSGLQEGEAYSTVVLRAKELGYTEPDPRDDLGGVDVARKALIIARTLGMEMEMKDVSIEPLYPPELADIPLSDFLSALPTLDESFRAKVAAAAPKVLRYAASVRPPTGPGDCGSLSVGLVAVDPSSPLGGLGGSDNLVEIHTKWYADTPLVLRGAGAGTGTTAAGVLADMLDLAMAREGV